MITQDIDDYRYLPNSKWNDKFRHDIYLLAISHIKINLTLKSKEEIKGKAADIMMLGQVLTVEWLVRFDIYGHVARLAGSCYRRSEVLVHQSPAPSLQHKEHSAIPSFAGRIVTEGNESQGRLLVFHTTGIPGPEMSTYTGIVPPLQITLCHNWKTTVRISHALKTSKLTYGY
jgi:hypothetical protein